MSPFVQDDDQTISSETSIALGCYFHSCQYLLSGLVPNQAASLDTVVEMINTVIIIQQC